MDEELSSEELNVILIENQPEIISKVHSLLTEIKECRLKVHSSHHELGRQVEAELPDLVLLAHAENAPQIVSEIRERSPDTYVVILLPAIQEDLVNEYINRRAHGLLFKNQNF
ncbi:hypothetical protein L0222_30605 [bacterium]|nr:hypothetical protein [bacterium]MCI0602191.1 hypothetical protein [bacterium]